MGWCSTLWCSTSHLRICGTRTPTKCLLLLHICLILGGFMRVHAAGSITSDRSALLAVSKEFTNWDSYFQGIPLSGWDPSGDPCSWSGVSCNAAGRVSSLNLSCDQCSFMLRGALPQSLVQLDALTSLDLSGNSVTGVLPTQWGAMDAFLLLTTLSLGDNDLSGELPRTWAVAPAFPQLKSLNLSHNKLQGSLPDTWTQPSGFGEISILEVADNNLTGTLPPEMADQGVLPSLIYLDVAGNLLGGGLPDAWGAPGAFPMLKDLDASRNYFTGPLPTSWGSSASAFSNLTVLSLSANRLQGELPESWGRGGGFRQLRELYLDTNAITGTLPPLWGFSATSWPSLVELGLSSCQLLGTLPVEWGSGGGMLKLQQLYLSYNRLSGTVPTAWTALPALTDLWLRPANWELCGVLPTSAAFTVCRANGTTCVPVVDALITGCDSGAAPTAADVEAVVRILGYNLLPFGKVQQKSLQQTLTADLDLRSESQVSLVYVQEVPDPFVRIDQPSGDKIGRRKSRRLLNVDGWEQRLLVAADSNNRSMAMGLASTAPLLMSGNLHVQAVDVTLELVTNTGEQAVSVGNALEEAVTGEGNILVEGLMTRGVNATGAQLLYNSYDGDNGIAAGPDGSPIPDRSSDQREHIVEIVVGSVSGVLVAILLAAAALCLTRRQRRRRRLAEEEGAAGRQLPNGGWNKGHGEVQLSNHSSNCTVSNYTVSSAANGSSPLHDSHSKQPSLLFPPLGSDEVNVGIDQDNLFRGVDDSNSSDATAGSSAKWLQTTNGGGGGGGGEGVQLPRVLFSDWELRPEDIHISSHPDGRPWELGSGAFGQVFKAQLGVQTVAVKMLTGHHHQPAAQEQFCREIAILRSCRCVNVVMFCGACVSDGNTMLVCEYMEGGDLWRILDKDRSRAVFGWYRRGKKVAVDVACGLHYLHSHRIVHFDLKSQNILLARDGTAKIADVGLARVLNREYLTTLHLAGTFAWAAPELLLGSRCTEKVDIYSFGMVLWEIITGERPLRGQIRDLRVPEECPPEVEELLMWCMATDPASRPSAKQIHEALLAVPYPASRGAAPHTGAAAGTAAGTASAVASDKPLAKAATGDQVLASGQTRDAEHATSTRDSVPVPTEHAHSHARVLGRACFPQPTAPEMSHSISNGASDGGVPPQQQQARNHLGVKSQHGCETSNISDSKGLEGGMPDTQQHLGLTSPVQQSARDGVTQHLPPSDPDGWDSPTGDGSNEPQQQMRPQEQAALALSDSQQAPIQLPVYQSCVSSCLDGTGSFNDNLAPPQTVPRMQSPFEAAASAPAAASTTLRLTRQP